MQRDLTIATIKTMPTAAVIIVKRGVDVAEDNDRDGNLILPIINIIKLKVRQKTETIGDDYNSELIKIKR